MGLRGAGDSGANHGLGDPCRHARDAARVSRVGTEDRSNPQAPARRHPPGRGRLLSTPGRARRGARHRFLGRRRDPARERQVRRRSPRIRWYHVLFATLRRGRNARDSRLSPRRQRHRGRDRERRSEYSRARHRRRRNEQVRRFVDRRRLAASDAILRRRAEGRRVIRPRHHLRANSVGASVRRRCSRRSRTTAPRFFPSPA